MQNDVVFFDPNVYRVILFDQRGCGKSEPYVIATFGFRSDMGSTGEIKENTTWDLGKHSVRKVHLFSIKAYRHCSGRYRDDSKEV